MIIINNTTNITTHFHKLFLYLEFDIYKDSTVESLVRNSTSFGQTVWSVGPYLRPQKHLVYPDQSPPTSRGTSSNVSRDGRLVFIQVLPNSIPRQRQSRQVISDLLEKEFEGLLVHLMVVIHLDHGRDGGGVALGYRDRVVGGGIAGNILSTLLHKTDLYHSPHPPHNVTLLTNDDDVVHTPQHLVVVEERPTEGRLRH